jgi:copper chaperone NosL
MCAASFVMKTAVLFIAIVLAACSQQQQEIKPLPQLSSRDDVGYFCGMIVEDHQGPKSQLFLAGNEDPLWFTSVRDGIAYTLLPGESGVTSAFYVTAMDKSDWNHPEKQGAAWIEARSAWYVIDSDKKGGMGMAEAIPFAEEEAAKGFVEEFGGRPVRLSRIPEAYILGHGQQHEPTQ